MIRRSDRIVGTRAVPRSSIRSMISWSPPWPCSTESTPARTAFRTPIPALGVGRHRHLALVGLLDGGCHLLDGQLRLAGLPARRHHPAGRHQLDRGRSGPEVLAGRSADRVGAVRLAADRQPWPPVIVDDPAAGEHAGARDLAGGDEGRELDVHVARPADGQRIVVTPARSVASSRAMLRTSVRLYAFSP